MLAKIASYLTIFSNFLKYRQIFDEEETVDTIAVDPFIYNA